MVKRNPSNGTNDTYVKQQDKLIKSIKDIVKRGHERGYIFFDKKVPKSLNVPNTIQPLQIPTPVKNPSKVTINRLQRIKDKLYENAIWNDPEYSPELPEYNSRTTPYKKDPMRRTGTFSGVEGRKIENSRRSRKAAKTRKRNKTETPGFEAPFAPQPPPSEPVWFPVFDQIEEYLNRLETIRGSGTEATQSAREDHGRNLIQFFRNRIDEFEADGKEHEYAKHLEDKAAQISSIVDDMQRDSKGERFEANVNLLCTILNGGPLSADQSDILTEYFNGEIDTLG